MIIDLRKLYKNLELLQNSELGYLLEMLYLLFFAAVRGKAVVFFSGIDGNIFDPFLDCIVALFLDSVVLLEFNLLVLCPIFLNFSSI